MKHTVEYNNIEDLNVADRDILLEQLWYKSMNLGSSHEIQFNLKEAKREIALNDGFADNICGRHIQMYLYIGNIVDSYLYDKHNGQGAFISVLELMRQQKISNNTSLLVAQMTTTHLT